MRIRFTLLVVAFLAVLMAGPGMVGAYSLSDIDFWVGSGAKEVGIVIDFNDGSEQDSFAWGYRYDEEDIGLTPGMIYERFLSLIIADIVSADYNLTGQYYTAGNGSIWYLLEYGDHSRNENDWEGMWMYHETDATELNGQEQWLAIDSRNVDPRWLAVNWISWNDFGNPAAVPSIPVSASSGTSIPTTPEPGSIFLLGLGILGMGTIVRGKTRR